MSAGDKIPGGYYLKARCVQQSDIAHAPPHIREIWDFILMSAFHKDGKKLKRGQCLLSYRDIQDGLSWSIGFRKCTYKKDQCETAMKWLRKQDMLTTRKTTRGMIITICNYDHYQTPENYENHNSTRMQTTGEPQSNHTIDKNSKKEKENIYVEIISDLNQRAGKRMRPDSKTTVVLIDKLLGRGFSVEDFCHVHKVKCRQWLGTENEKYLKPENLYRESKFQDYAEEPDIDKPYNEQTDEQALVSYYAKTIQPAIADTARAVQTVKTHFETYDKRDMRIAVSNYANTIAQNEIEPRYRKSANSFFDLKTPAFIDYLPENYRQPSKTLSGGFDSGPKETTTEEIFGGPIDGIE